MVTIAIIPITATRRVQSCIASPFRVTRSPLVTDQVGDPGAKSRRPPGAGISTERHAHTRRHRNIGTQARAERSLVAARPLNEIKWCRIHRYATTLAQRMTVADPRADRDVVHGLWPEQPPDPKKPNPTT